MFVHSPESINSFKIIPNLTHAVVILRRNMKDSVRNYLQDDVSMPIAPGKGQARKRRKTGVEGTSAHPKVGPVVTARGHGRGIACMVAGTSVFAAMDALVKALMADYPVVQVLFFRSAFALLPLAPLLLREGRAALATTRPWAHVARSGIGMVAIACFFVAFRELPLAQVTTIAFAAPLVVTALSVPVLGEAVGPRRWAAVGAGFVGVVVIVRPEGFAGFDLGLATALVGTLLYAVVMVLIRAMSGTERPLTIVGWFTLSSIVASGSALPWFWVAPDGWDWGLLAAVGILGGVGQLLITHAVRLAPVAVVMPFDYLHLVFAVALGWAFWAEMPGLRTLVGGAVIVAAGLYVLHRETRN